MNKSAALDRLLTKVSLSGSSDLETVNTLVTALRTGPKAARSRLWRGIEVLTASSDGRYLEALDLHLSQLEQVAEKLSKT